MMETIMMAMDVVEIAELSQDSDAQVEAQMDQINA